MDLTKAKKTIKFEEFFHKYYINYVLYRVMQRLPSIIDGCIQTHRKIIYTCLDKNITVKTKVADLSSIVSLHTKYHHGVGSIESAIANMVPLFANNIPLLKEDGAYGSRSNRKASAPRYIETRLYPHSEILFNKLDNANFVIRQSTENKEIEPQNLICSLPLLLINGMDQIGVGYNCKILPRDPFVIIDVLKRILSGELKTIPTELQVKHHDYNGQITFNQKKNSWQYRGIITQLPKGIIRISEVPYKYTSESYLNKLEALVTKGIIKSYSEKILANKFEIDIKFVDPEKYTGKKYNEEILLKLLGLISNQSETIVALDATNNIMVYDNVGQILYEYIMYMLGIYKKRKDLLLHNMNQNLLKYTNRIKFIQLINDGVIVTKGKRKSQLSEELAQHRFETLEDSYDYLTKMTIETLVLDKIEELLIKIENINSEIESLSKETHATLWLKDIENIEKNLKKDLPWDKKKKSEKG